MSHLSVLFFSVPWSSLMSSLKQTFLQAAAPLYCHTQKQLMCTIEGPIRDQVLPRCFKTRKIMGVHSPGETELQGLLQVLPQTVLRIFLLGIASCQQRARERSQKRK